jgi:glycosyltransferase involved in cell wall biosynthesis
VLAGRVADGYGDRLLRAVERMRAAGAEVELRDWFQDEEEYRQVLASARCVALAYPRHYGMSRVLVEAASAGTPVIAGEWGLVGHLVRKYGIGMAVDPTDRRAMRRSLVELCEDDAAPARFAPALANFASRYRWSAFVDAITRGLALPPSEASQS